MLDHGSIGDHFNAAGERLLLNEWPNGPGLGARPLVLELQDVEL